MYNFLSPLLKILLHRSIVAQIRNKFKLLGLLYNDTSFQKYWTIEATIRFHQTNTAGYPNGSTYVARERSNTNGVPRNLQYATFTNLLREKCKRSEPNWYKNVGRGSLYERRRRKNSIKFCCLEDPDRIEVLSGLVLLLKGSTSRTRIKRNKIDTLIL